MSKEKLPPSVHQPVRLWPYALLGSFLMFVFVSGILAPDYFNYRLSLAKIKQVGIMAKPSPAQQSSETNAVARAKNTPVAVDDSKLEIKSSDIFETYGKLLTMLLAFVSVLGVFFGYFVRRSLREVEEDLRGHVQTTLDLWGRRYEELASGVTTQLEEIGRQKTEFEEIVRNSRKVLEALEAEAKSREQENAPPVAPVKDAAAAIDADPSIPQSGAPQA